MVVKLSNLAVMATLGLVPAAAATASEGLRVDELAVATSIPQIQRNVTVSVARAFYESPRL